MTLPSPASFDFNTSLIARHGKTQFREVGAEIFLVHPDGVQIHNLNPTAAALWRLLEEPLTARDMVDILQTAFPIIAMAKLEADVGLVLSQFLELGFARLKT